MNPYGCWLPIRTKCTSETNRRSRWNEHDTRMCESTGDKSMNRWVKIDEGARMTRWSLPTDPFRGLNVCSVLVTARKQVKRVNGKGQRWQADKSVIILLLVGLLSNKGIKVQQSSTGQVSKVFRWFQGRLRGADRLNLQILRWQLNGDPLGWGEHDSTMRVNRSFSCGMSAWRTWWLMTSSRGWISELRW